MGFAALYPSYGLNDYGIDANAIIAAAQAIAPGRPIRYLGAA